MITQTTLLGILLFALHSSLLAAWHINTSGQKGIYATSSDSHQLSIVEKTNGIDFFLSLQTSKTRYNPDHAVIQIGDMITKTGKLQLIDKQSGQQTYLLKLERSQQTSLLNKMISGLVISIRIIDKGQQISPFEFSLSGFTARLNDFLIAREIGQLDYEWLLENHKDRELLCYYAANIYVKAIQDRLDKGNYRKTLDAIPKTGIEKLDSVTGEMVQNVYSIPARNLPTDPRGDKYGIFKACMSQAN